MLSCQKHHFHFPCSSILHSLSSTPTTSTTIVNCQNPDNNTNNLNLRKQNSKSTSFLLHQLQQQKTHHAPQQYHTPHEEKIKLSQLSHHNSTDPQQYSIPHEEKTKLLEHPHYNSNALQQFNIPHEEKTKLLEPSHHDSNGLQQYNIPHEEKIKFLEHSQHNFTELQQYNIPHEEKIKLLELSLVRKRTPQFPGSIYVQSPGDPDVGSSLPPLRTLFKEHVEGESGENGGETIIMRAIEIRRKVTREIFLEAMRKGKFGITYATNLVNRLTGFIDYVMIEAASMKRLPQFSHSTFNLRAKTVIEDSQVVPLIRWLKHNALSYHRISKLILMSRGNLESIRRIAEWLRVIHVKGEFIGVTLVNAGDNILDRSNKELDEIVYYLESKGVRSDWIGYVISRCPQLLSYSLEEVKTRAEFYLDMGLNDHDFGTMVFDYPKVLGYFTLEEMNQKVNYLKEFGLKAEDVGRLVAFKPRLMACSIEEGWKPLAKYLYYFGVTRDGMKRMLTIKPMVFCIDLQTNIVPKVKFFQDLGIRDDAIGNMLVKFPTLLTYSLIKKIRPVVIFLMTKAGVSDENIAKTIALGPELLGCSIPQKLEVSVKYYLSLGIRLKQLGEMVADFPMLLRYNIDILRRKYTYLRRTMVRPLEDLIEFPRFFSYSLNGRIIPRHKILVENRINVKLRYMLACSDEEFRKLVDSQIRKRQKLLSAGTSADVTNSQT